MPTIAYVAKHPDGSDCPEFSYPRQSACPLVGTGIHAHAPFVPTLMTTDEDVLSHFIGSIDIAYWITTGEKRRVVQL